ncbi:MAG TPA: Rdx family protein [Gaiellaceae bacterium]
MAELNGLGHVADMVEGEQSQFDVLADEQLVYSKQRAGRFPELADLVPALPAPPRV